MTSTLFKDLNLSTNQINSNYSLAKLNTAGVQVDAVQGNNANNNILIGDAITNVPNVANMIIIGDGNKTNAKAKDILLGDGVTCQNGDIAGTLHLGEGMKDIEESAGTASTHYMPIYYNGALLKVLVKND
jgi:hypothetical protein